MVELDGAQLRSGVSEATGETSTSKRLDVPYFCQYNFKEGGRVCNNTSLAMVANFNGKKTTPDTIYDAVGGPSLSLGAVVSAAKKIGLDPVSSTIASVADMKKEIDAGRPFVLGGYFTGKDGHYVVITGYDVSGFFVNDPAGWWDESTFSPGAGYISRGKCPGVTGYDRHFSYSAIKKANAMNGYGGDNEFWVVYIR